MASNPHPRHDNRDDVNKVVMWLFGLAIIGGAMFVALAPLPVHS
ncbi:MAG TPA: hypothetical protein VHP58_06960 [Alphaproteobacteria bacterium]|nr:hypothetical protein [Alphaproteobacteria bacterium]